MGERPILRSSTHVAMSRDRGAVIRSGIAALLNDPCVAARVKRSLDHRGRSLPDALPIWLSPGEDDRVYCAMAPGKRMMRRDECGKMDCLCGRYPVRLSEGDVCRGRVLERFAG